ncbi:MAG: beta-N-acetylhexosaminidase [Bacteroidetes bacterium]|nr:beta-N-acetylhexosaminidase [Bacteroidota bacterium]
MPTRKSLFALLVLFVLIPSVLFPQIYSENYKHQQNDVMPYPANMVINRGLPFIVDNDFTVTSAIGASKKLSIAINDFAEKISRKTGIVINEENRFMSRTAGLLVYAENESPAGVITDESYTVEVAQYRIILKSKTDVGALRGLQTILQLVQFANGKYYVPACRISDAPRFPWRGLLIDVSRHFMPVEVIKRNIDGMTAVKLNVLHLHLADNQGFRVECKAFPKLHEMGSDGNYFTQEQIKDIIKYANDRGIRVVPEFDIPGHSTAWFAGYPEYASAPGPYEIERHFGVFDPCFDPTKESVYDFFDKFFAEMSALFNDEYIHIGGDENEGKQWDANADIQAFMKQNGFASNHELQAYFNKRIQKILEKYGKKMIGWDEIFSESLPKDILIHSWRGKEAMMKAAQLGYASILSSGYYIDLCQSVFDHYFNDPMPPDINLTSEEKKLILGGEATMWAELVNPDNVDSRIWPRTAAIAEVLWTGVKNFSADSLENKFILYRRFDNASNFLNTAGLKHQSNRKLMLANVTDKPELLENILKVWEPLKYYNRHKYTKYSQTTPLNRPVDIAVPDAPLSFEFNYLTKRILSRTAEAEEIESGRQAFLKLSKDCDAFLDGKKKEDYKDAELIAEKTKGISSIITTILYSLQKKERPGEETFNLDYYKGQTAELELSLLPALKELYDYVEKGKHLK